MGRPGIPALQGGEDVNYRGIQFEGNNASVETSTLGISGTYRGRKTSFSRSTATPATSGTQMQFMGKRYTA